MGNQIKFAKEFRKSIIFYRESLKSGYTESIIRAQNAMDSAQRRLEYAIKIGGNK